MGLTTETFPTDANTFATMMGHPGLELLATGDRGPVFSCVGDCATLWWPDTHVYDETVDGQDVLVLHADRYPSANGGSYCDDCRAVPDTVMVDPDTLTFVGGHPG